MKEQLHFWNSYQEYMAKNSGIRCQKPQSRQWMNHSVAWPSDIHLTSIISTRNLETGEPEIRVELGLLGGKGKRRFDALKLKQEKIDREIKLECDACVIWHVPPRDKDMHKIYVSNGTDFRQREHWDKQQRWLRDHVELFKKVFDPIIPEID
jgi:hypothetical protein